MSHLFDSRNTDAIDLDAADAYRKNGTVWLVNGKEAMPADAQMARALRPQDGTMESLKSLIAKARAMGDMSPEAIMMAYLDNMNAAIADQRDVMLGYLNQGESQPLSYPRAAARPIARRGFGDAEGAEPQEYAYADGRQAGWEQGYAPEGYAPEGYAPEGYAPEGAGAYGEAYGEYEGAGELPAEDGAAARAPENTSGLPEVFALSRDELKDIILDVVSKNTGYPPDMLGLEIDLEADLSIDSIKRLEIIGALRERVYFPEGAIYSEESFGKMVEVKTLNGLINWIMELGENAVLESGDGAGPEAGGAGTDADADADAGATFGEDGQGAYGDEGDAQCVNRLKLELIPHSIDNGTHASILEKRFALADDGLGLASSLKDLLEMFGAFADVVDWDAEDLSEYDGIVVINAYASPERRTVPDLFRLVKAADLQKLQWLHVYDDVPGALLQSGSVEGIDMLEGFSGFIKTLAREHLNVNIRMVNSFDPIDPASFPVTAMGELGVAEKFVEFVYENFERKRYLPVLCDIDESAPLSFELDEDSNVLVLGGAQGITKELIAKLAAECPCRYILVGRSQENEEEARRYWDLNSIDEIRSRLISEGELKNPREIEKRASAIHKTAQIAKAKKQLGEDIGAKVCYYAADVSDEDEFVRLIDDVRAKYGKIDAVFHAVGVLEDKLFTVKTLESFERTYYTKVTPLRVIARELLPDLKLLVMFGSVAATFGNQGQIDYAAGNTVFDLAACLIKKNQEQTRVISFNWGPWSGTGMVSPGLEAEFKNRGLSMIHVEEGSGFFMDDVMYGGDLPVVLALAGDSGDLDLFIENALDMTTWRPTAVYMKGAII